MNEALCKSCKSPILWAITEHGRRMPLDLPAQRRFVLDGDTCRSTVVYTSHFSSCPNADQHRSAA